MLDIKKLIEEARSEAENFRSFDEDDKPLEKGDLTGIANLIDNLCDQLEKHPLEVQVDEDTKIVAESDVALGFNEIAVYLLKNGVVWQDLAIVRQAYVYGDNDEIIHKPGQYEVLVYGNPDDEDFTNRFLISEYKE
ncbi:MAG: hypothetical protein IJI83_03110 [Oscillospiraceae bacterium]|nr:hypothetical protein [Oscillospiraceae bacterium]